MVQLTGLPNEILTRIISLLDLESIYIIKDLNKKLNELSKSILMNSIQLRLFGLSGIHSSTALQSDLLSNKHSQSIHLISLVIGPPTNENELKVCKDLESSMDITNDEELTELIPRLHKLENIELNLLNLSQWSSNELQSLQRLLYSLATLRKLKNLKVTSNDQFNDQLTIPPIQSLESLIVRGCIPSNILIKTCVENSRNLKLIKLPNDEPSSSQVIENLNENSLPLLEFFEGRSDDIVELTNENVSPNLKRLRYIPHKEGDESLEEIQSTLKVLDEKPLMSFAYETLFTFDFNVLVDSLKPFSETLTSLAIGNPNALAPEEITLEERLVGEIRFATSFIDHLPRLSTVCLTYVSDQGLPHLPSGNSGTTTLPDGTVASYFDRVAALWFRIQPTLIGFSVIFLDGSPCRAWHAIAFGIDQQNNLLDVDDSWRRFKRLPTENALPAVQSWLEEL